MESILSLKPVSSDSLSRQIFESLKDGIFVGTFQPGETLRELHLASLYQVSQATIREALVRLEQAGLVVRMPNRKTTVTSFTNEEVRDRLQMRILLEELAFARAATRMSEEDLSTLSEMAVSIDNAIDGENNLQITMEDVKFHRFVWERAGSAVLFKTLEQLTTPLFAFFNVMHIKGATDMRKTKSHQTLVDVLRGKDESAIRNAVRFHIETSYDRLTRLSEPSTEALFEEAVSAAASD